MIKVIIEKDNLTETFYVNSASTMAKVNEKLLSEYLKEADEIHQSFDRIDKRVNEMGYDSLDEALTELVDFKEEREELLETQEDYENLEHTADCLGYDSVDDALNDLEEIKSAMSDISDIANRFN